MHNRHMLSQPSQLSVMHALLLLLLMLFALANEAFAHNVGQAQTSKYFDPDTVQMLKDRASGAIPGGPGLRQNDIISYIVESVPAPNGASLGAAGYILDYIPPGVEVVGAHFVNKVPDPTKYDGWAYIDASMPYPGVLSDGWGIRGANGYLAPFGEGSLSGGVQDTGVFYSTDPRTARLVTPYDVTICTKAKLAGTQLAFLVYNQWDYDQFMGVGNSKGCATLPPSVYPDPQVITGGSGRGNPPVMDLSGVGTGPWIGLGSPVAGANSFYKNDFNPLGDGNALINSPLDFSGQGPWHRIQHPGSLEGGSGVIAPVIAIGTDTISGVPATGGWTLSSANPLPRTTNVVRFAIGERTIGDVEHIRLKVRIYDLAAFGAGSPIACIPSTMPGGNCAIDPYTNLSSVFGADASGGAQGGKDHAYAYLGPSQANNNAQLVTTKAVVAVSATVAGPWIASDGAFLSIGQFVKYRLTYLNAASATLTNVFISDLIDAGSAAYSGSASTGNPFLGAPTVVLNKVTWPVIPVLMPGGGGNVELIVEIIGAGVGGISSNQIFGTATAPDGATIVDSYAASVSTIAASGVPANISLSKTATPVAVATGQLIHYTMILNNSGGAISDKVQGETDPLKGRVYPATAAVALVVGDEFPIIAAAGDVMVYSAAPAPVITITDTTTAIQYPLAQGTDYTVDTTSRPGDVFWIINSYPAGHLNATLPFDFVNSTLQIDFYATTITAVPGVYYNTIEAESGDILSGKDITKLAVNQAPVTIGAAPSFATSTKIAVDINGGVLIPGEEVRYDFNLTNVGLAATTTLTMLDPIPTGADFILGSVSAVGATISYLDQYSAAYIPTGVAGATDPYVRYIKLIYGVINIGASVTPSLTVRIPSPNVDSLQLVNQASIDVYAGIVFSQFVTDDPNQGGTQDPTLISITAKPDFSTTSKTVLVNGAASTQTGPGDNLAYTINFVDSGTSSNGSTNVSIKDTVDLTRLENIVLGATPAGWGVVGPDPYSGLISWTAATLAHGATATFSFTADVKLSVPNGDSVNNSVVLTSDQTTSITINAPTLTVPTTKVTGTVFDDQNTNAVQGGTEGGMQNVTVALRIPGFGSDIIIASTDANGYYELIAPISGDWYVQITDDFNVLTGRALTTTNNPIAVNLPNGTTTTNQNFGYGPRPVPAVISGTIFNDLDGSGAQNGGEGGHTAVTLTLKNAANVIIATTSSNASGAYDFSGLTTGSYTLEITDSAAVLADYYLTTGLVSPYSVVNLATLETRTIDFGYRIGSRVGDLVFHDLDQNGIWSVGDSAIAGISMELRQAGIVQQSSTTDASGAYLFSGVEPGSYDIYADATGILLAFTSGTLISPYTMLVVADVDNLAVDFDYYSAPVITASKTTSTGVVGFYEAAEYTITITNTGGAAANFVVRDILPTTIPPVTVPPYTMSSSGFLYLSTNTVLLNGAPFTIPSMPTLYGTQPIWSGFTMPAASTLTIQFTSFSGANEGVNYNGVQTEYNNTAVPPATMQNFPDLAIVLISDVGKVTKRVAAINGVLWSGAGTPIVAGNDVISYEVQIINTPAALPHAISAMRDYLPTGFTYKVGTAFVTDAVNYPTGVAVVGSQLGNQLDFAMPAPNPSTGATYPGTVTLNFDAYAATGTTGTFTDNAGMLVSVNLLPAIDVYSGNTAAVTLTQFRIGDTVFFDNDASGTLNVGDTYAAAVTLELRPTGGGVGSAVATVTTDANGQYGFLINTAGTYDVVVTDTGGILLSHASSTGGKTQTATVNNTTTSVQSLDFGYIPPALSAVIEGTVFDDYNNNSTKDVGEAGIAAVTLGLYNLFGTLINTYSTPVGGTFRFAGIAGGLYQINVITPPTGYGGTSTTLPVSINVADGTTSVGNDIGYLPFGSLAGNIFSDTSGDGIQQAGETTIFAGVVVERYNAAMTLIDTYTSNASGDYIFSKIVAADYYVQVQAGFAPVGHGATTTQPLAVTVVNAVINTGNNMGYQPNGNVAGVVFLDTNANGTKEGGETTVFAGVVIDRYTIGMGYIDSYTADVNGLFQFSLIASGDYYVQVRTDPVGYGPTTTQPLKVTAVNATTSTGNDLGYQTFGSVGGTVFEDVDGSANYNAGDNFYAGVTVDRYTTAGVFIDSYTTDASGAYQFSQVTAGNYHIYAYPPALYGATTTIPLVVTASNGITSSSNDIGFRIYGSLSGTVFSDGNGNATLDGGEGGLAAVVVDRYSGGVYVDSYTSDGSGAFQFSQIAAGSYDLYAHIPAGYGATTGQPLATTVTLGVNSTGNNIGFRIFGSVSGTVFSDDNGNATMDGGEAALSGIVVDRYSSGGTFIDSYTSTASGAYEFRQIPAGNYNLYARIPTGYGASTGQPLAVTATLGVSNTGNNIGFRIFGSISGTIFSDVNGNTSMDGGEPAIAAVVVDRYSGGIFVDSYTADGSGAYQFVQIPAGNYDLYAHTPAGYGATTSQPLTVTATLGISNTGNNIGFQQAATISGKVFADVNNNGAFDAGDAWLSGVTVYLKKAGITVDTYTTTAGGGYDFTGLLVLTSPSVAYTVDVDETLTPINNATLTAGSDPSSVTVTLGSTNTVADIGYLIQGSISGTIYEDKNATLAFDTTPLPADTALTGAVVNLYDSGMVLLSTSSSAVDGSFSFTGLVGADYYVEVVTPATYSAVAPTVIPPATQPVLAITLTSGSVLTGKNFGFTLPPNLTVTKTTVSPFVSRDSPMTYTITVSNSGGTANNVVITDWVPNLAFAGWLGVPAPTISVEGVTTPSATATELWFNGVLVTATLPLAPYTQTTVANTTTAWSMTPTGFTLNNGDVLKFVFTVDSLAVGTEGTFFNSLQIDYLNGATAVTDWYPDINTVTATRTYFPDKQVIAVNGVAWGGGVPTIDVGDTVTWQVTITNLRGKGTTGKDEIAVWSLTDTLPLGFKYVLGSSIVTSPGNLTLPVNPIADPVVTSATLTTSEVLAYTFNFPATKTDPTAPNIADPHMITGASLNDTATLQFDVYAYDALTPNAPAVGNHSNRATIVADRATKAGVTETIIGATVNVSSNAHVSGVVFHELTVDMFYNASDTPFNGITVELQPGGGGAAVDSYTTGTNGLFDLVAPGAGSYQVVITDTAGILSGFTSPPLIAPAMPVVLTDGQRLTGQDYGYVLAGAAATVNGTIFSDGNADGILNGADAGILAATVNLTNLIGTVLATASSDAAGLFTFSNLASGNYKIDVVNSSTPLVGLYNTPAASPVDPYTLTIAAGSTSTKNFGWAAGATFNGTVFDAASLADNVFLTQPGHANVTMNLVNTATGTTIRTTTTAYSPVSPAITPKLGRYSFDAVAPGSYRIDVADAFGELTTYALTTANQPMTAVAAAAGISYINNFGYFKAPNISVLKTMAASTLDKGSKMDVTLTVTNTGGGVANFKIADVMPASTVAPASPFAGGLGGFLLSDINGPIDFEFSQLLTIKLNGVPLTLNVDYYGAVAASVTPTWTLPGGLPGNATLEIHFTGVQLLANNGSTGSPNYNGASIQYGPAAGLTTVDYPNLVTFAVADRLTFDKKVTAINGTAYIGTGRPVIHPGDQVTFQLVVANTIRGSQLDVGSFSDTLPADMYGNGLNYILGTSILTNPLAGGVPTLFADPGIVLGTSPYTFALGGSETLTWTLPAPPSVGTNVGFPSEVIMQFDAYASTSMLPGLYVNQGAATAERQGNAPLLPVNASRDFELAYDLTISKTVDRPSTPPGGFVTYTVSIVNNTATGSISNLTLTDQLSNGFSYMLGTSKFNGVATGDPGGTSTQPIWTLPAIAGGTTLTVSFTADVASWTTLGSHTNTATLKDIRAVTVATTGATAPVNIAAQPLLTVIKQSNVASAAPGGVIIYTVTTQNTGAGVATNVAATDHLSGYTQLAVNPWGNGTPVQFTDGANASGLTVGGVTYSNDGGATFAYPLNTGTYDPYVTNFKVQMSGIMNANQTANPKFDLQYQVQVK